MVTAQSLIPAKTPMYYVNGFSGGLGAADVAFNFNVGSDPVVELRMSHAVARDLHTALHEILKQYETSTGQKLEGTKAINTKLAANSKKSSPQKA